VTAGAFEGRIATLARRTILHDLRLEETPAAASHARRSNAVMIEQTFRWLFTSSPVKTIAARKIAHDLASYLSHSPETLPPANELSEFSGDEIDTLALADPWIPKHLPD
jgi:hypothetical protein